MLRKCLLSLVLCGVLGTLSNAQTDSKVQISEPLSGVEAKKALQNFPKESKSALKVKKVQKEDNFLIMAMLSPHLIWRQIRLWH